VISTRSAGQLAGLGGSTVLESLREEEEGEEEEYDAPPSSLGAAVPGRGAQAHLAAGSDVAAGQSTGVSQPGDALSPEELACILRDPVFQEFSEYVVESALLGLIQESAAGEWEPPSSNTTGQ
jgi:hypothetical protein